MQHDISGIFDSAKLEEDPEFLNLKIQTKFLRGDLKYNEKEFKILKNWLSSKNAHFAKEYFIEEILPWTSVEITTFNKSPLARLLDDLIWEQENKKIKEVELSIFQKIRSFWS